MIDYVSLVTEEFRKSFESACARQMSSLCAFSVGDHPLLRDTLKSIDGHTEVVDEVSAALTKRAQELQAFATVNRDAPEWPDVCIAMAAVRNAAAEVWRVDAKRVRAQ